MKKLALVTGSTSGIGLGIARSLAEAGYRIILNGFGTPDAIDSVLSELVCQFIGANLYRYRLTNAVSIEKAIGELLSSEGRECPG